MSSKYYFDTNAEGMTCHDARECPFWSEDKDCTEIDPDLGICKFGEPTPRIKETDICMIWDRVQKMAEI